MRSRQTIVAELGQITSRYNAVLKEHEGKDLPAEAQAELEKLHARGGELKEELEKAKAQEKRHADVAQLQAYLEEPATTVPLPLGNKAGDGDAKKILAEIGWEERRGVLYAPTSLGQHVAMFPSEVLFGAMPTADADRAKYFRQTRAAIQPTYRAAFLRYVELCTKSRSEAMAFSQLTSQEQAALLEGQDEKGGFLVPVDSQAEVLARIPASSVMRRYCRVQATSRDKLSWPRVQAHGTDGSIYTSAFVGDWVGETPAFTETDPKWGLFDIPIKKLRVATKPSNDFLSDALVNVLAFLSTDGAENIALVEDKGFINGDGTALQPNGILQSGATETDVSGTTADQISNTTTDAGSAPKLIDWVYTLPDQYVGNAIVLLKRSEEGKVRKLVDAQGRYHWPLTGFGATPDRLFEFPKANSPFMPAGGTDANRVGLVGDLRNAYIIAQRAQISVVIMRERFADTDQTGIVIFERVGGDTFNSDAIRIAKV